MAFCKVCSCGEKVVFERRLSFPDECPNCGRRLMDFQTYPEDDPMVNALMRVSHESEKNDEFNINEKEIEIEKYALRLENGQEILIPSEGGIIGRTELGGEELASFSSVSRKHIKLIIRKNIGVMIEDLSSFGTLVNGKRIEKNFPMRIEVGTKITLCNIEAELIKKGGI